jgi:hypothetical protein
MNTLSLHSQASRLWNKSSTSMLTEVIENASLGV